MVEETHKTEDLSEFPGKRSLMEAKSSMQPPAKKNKVAGDEGSLKQDAVVANVIVQFQSEDGEAVGKYIHEHS